MNQNQFRRALLPLVADNSETVCALGVLVAKHCAVCGISEPFDVPTKDYVRRRAAAARLGAALDGLAAALAAAPEDLLNAVAGAAPHLHSGSLADWQQDLGELQETTAGLHSIQRGPRGAPVNRRRQALEYETFRIVRRAGLRLTKSRDGVLAKILTVMYEAAHEPCPIDVFPVLRRLLPNSAQVNKSPRLTKT